GLFLDAPIRWNTVALNEPSILQQRKREAAVVERYHRALGIKHNHSDQTVRTLYGGKHQNVLLARFLEAVSYTQIRSHDKKRPILFCVLLLKKRGGGGGGG
ncbi:hypothetical protein ACVGWG_00220, partial [Enterobacter asburiae]